MDSLKCQNNSRLDHNSFIMFSMVKKLIWKVMPVLFFLNGFILLQTRGLFQRTYFIRSTVLCIPFTNKFELFPTLLLSNYRAINFKKSRFNNTHFIND